MSRKTPPGRINSEDLLALDFQETPSPTAPQASTPTNRDIENDQTSETSSSPNINTSTMANDLGRTAQYEQQAHISDINWSGSTVETAATAATWTAAMYNTMTSTARNYDDFAAYQATHIESKELLLALKFAAACHTEEVGEYHLAVAEARRMGMTSGVHFKPFLRGPWGPVSVDGMPEWLRIDDDGRRKRMVRIVEEMRAYKKAREGIWRVIEETRVRWRERDLLADRELMEKRERESEGGNTAMGCVVS